MDVKFTDACHIRINGDDIYKSNIDTLMGTYQIKKGKYKRGIANIVKHYCPQILPVMGITAKFPPTWSLKVPAKSCLCFIARDLISSFLFRFGVLST